MSTNLHSILIITGVKYLRIIVYLISIRAYFNQSNILYPIKWQIWHSNITTNRQKTLVSKFKFKKQNRKISIKYYIPF